jgi:DNA modification methylase
MKFPIINQSKVKYQIVIMALVIESQIDGQIYGRKYYRVIFEDNSECVFLTTNEPDSRFENRFIDEDFTLVSNFKEMMNEFENTELVGLAFDAGFISPPKYIYYDIITMDNSLKPQILEHLMHGISGYTELDFTKHEQVQINKWIVVLES